MHHFKLKWKRRLNKLSQAFRVKYWFKKGIKESFAAKIQEKIDQRSFETSIRLMTLSDGHESVASIRMRALIGAWQNFNTLDLNQIDADKVKKDSKQDLLNFRKRKRSKKFMLSSKELATIFHLPNAREVPNLIHVLSKKGEPPADLPVDRNSPEISFFGETNFHGKKIPFGLYRKDRRRHLYAVGKSGSGKSVTSLSIMQLVAQPPGKIVGGKILYYPKGQGEIDLLQLSDKEMQDYRGNE